MDDLISRDAAIDYLMTNMGWHDEDGYAVDDADEKRAIITDLVKGIPAVDAVPVVRCKDCKYAQHDVMYDDLWCDGMIRQPDWYCADGEQEGRK